MAHKTSAQLRQQDDKASPAGYARYRWLLILLFPLMTLYTAIQAIKVRDGRYFLQRMGFCYANYGDIDYWVHAASVGEVKAATPLLQALIKHHPAARILLTTTTPTGAQVARNLSTDSGKSADIQLAYLPIDFVFALRRLLKKALPRCVLIMETEIWPNLFRLCGKAKIPLITVNGRLSQRTLQTAGWIRDLYRSTLQYSSLILTRSDNDSKGYVALGADPKKVKTVGNIKYAVDIYVPGEKPAPFKNREYILAASTHDDEEWQLARLWKQRSRDLDGRLLVIAPRHPKRTAKILNQLRGLALTIAVHSRNDPVADSTDIYLIDTLGELDRFMRHASVIFMGGSLATRGGHNILEPAALGKAIIFGPHMENFADEAQLFIDHDAAIQVRDIDQAGDTITQLLRNPQRIAQLGNNAVNLLEDQRQVGEKYVTEIQSLLST